MSAGTLFIPPPRLTTGKRMQPYKRNGGKPHMVKTAADDVAQGIATLAKAGTAEGVADMLLHLDMKGHRRDGWNCPVSRFLKTLAGSDAVVSVAATKVLVWMRRPVHEAVSYCYVDGCPCWTTQAQAVVLPVPQCISEFIQSFDQGLYAALDVNRLKSQSVYKLLWETGADITAVCNTLPAWTTVDA